MDNFHFKYMGSFPEMFLLQDATITLESSNVFIDVGNAVSIKDKEGSLRLVIDTLKKFSK